MFMKLKNFMNSLSKLSKKDFKDLLKYEKQKNIGNMSLPHRIKICITGHPTWKRWQYIKYLRLSDYHGGQLLSWYYLRRKNKLANLLGFEITSTNICKGLTLYHNGPIVINGSSVIGENVCLHGDNCIGNDGITDECPVIGNNVDIGVGAKIIGSVHIADNVRIGAGAVVVKDINQQGAVVVGVPAKIIR